jgi:hypothetical protein
MDSVAASDFDEENGMPEIQRHTIDRGNPPAAASLAGRRGLLTYFLDDSALLFDEGRQKLYLANATAAVIAC